VGSQRQQSAPVVARCNARLCKGCAGDAVARAQPPLRVESGRCGHLRHNRTAKYKPVRTAWSTDILLGIDRDAPQTLRAQLESQLRDAIDQGRLAADTVLPSTRELALSLQLSRGVVVEAYDQLTAEGYIFSRRGSGARVAARDRTPLAMPPESDAQASTQVRFDFKPGLPHPDSFPRRAWAACLSRASLDATAAQLGYPDPRGEPAARTALSRYLARSRAVAVHPARVLLCSGFTQALDLIARTLFERGLRRVALERPGMPALAAHFKGLGWQVTLVPVDRDGMNVRELARSDAQVVILAPAHQFPTGAVLSTARRGELLAWAQERGAWIVEDDYDAEFRYGPGLLPALQAAAPDHVIYVGTASKILSPALRLGWIAAPEPLVGPLALMKQRVDKGGAVLEHVALARFIDKGLLDRHLKRCRVAYRRRRDTLLAALSRSGIVEGVLGEAAGLHVMVILRSDIDEQRLVDAARKDGIRVHGGANYRQRVAVEAPSLVLGYGVIEEHELHAGVTALAEVANRCGVDTRCAADCAVDSLTPDIVVGDLSVSKHDEHGSNDRRGSGARRGMGVQG
jgi:GntR family transcriptional regulator / MocR family aminotransferase